MKKLLIIIFWLISISLNAQVPYHVYYVATTGNDAATGDITHPWLTWNYGMTHCHPGDILYIRGGTYYSSGTADAVLLDGRNNGYGYAGTAANPILFSNYPGEVPILDCRNQINTSTMNIGIYCKFAAYWTFKGLTIRNVYERTNSTNAYAWLCWWESDHLVFENCTVDHIGGEGFSVGINYHNVSFVNCDASFCCDTIAHSPGQYGSGFAEGNENYDDAVITYYGCRAWHCSDQGFAGRPRGYVKVDHCWAFDNDGLYNGDGWGFKMSVYDSYEATPAIQREAVNCISSNNAFGGFGSNDQGKAAARLVWYNNFAYHNGYKGKPQAEAAGSGFLTWTSLSTPGSPLTRILKNNVAYANEYHEDYMENAITHDHNSWDIPLIPNASDFQSLDYTQLYGARKADGSLPDITFGKLTSSSKFIDAGTTSGIPTIAYNGTAPDLGWFEFPSYPVYYISTTGSNANDGSAAHPWASLSYACSQVTTSGSVIHVNAGTYTAETPAVECVLAPGVSIEGAGSATTIIKSHYQSTRNADITHACITLASSSLTDGAQHISGITLDGDNLMGYIGIVVRRRNNVIIHDCIIKNLFTNGISFIGNQQIESSVPTLYATGNQFYNNTITNCGDAPETWDGGATIEISGQQTMLIHDNVFSETTRAAGHNGDIMQGRFNKDIKYYNNVSTKPDYDGADFNFHLEMWYSQGFEVYGNTFHGGDCSIDCGNGILASNTKGAYNYSWYIHNNYFTGSPASYQCGSFGMKEAIDVESYHAGPVQDNEDVWICYNHTYNIPGIVQIENSAYRIYVLYNIMERVGWGGTGCYSNAVELYTGTLYDIYINNNVIVGNPADYPGFIDGLCTVSGITVENNIVSGMKNGPWFIQTGSISGKTITNNLLYNNTNNSPTSGNLVSPGFSTAPGFVSSTDFHLTSGSPCLDAGVDIDVPTNFGTMYDYQGVAVSSPPEVGAFEYGGAITIPTVTTSAVTSVTYTSAYCGGNVTADGGAAVTVKGICYSTSQNPTIANSPTNDGTGTGSFTTSLTGLAPLTVYYVRAYATNSVGTGYGSQMSFTTGTPPVAGGSFLKSGNQLVKSGNNFVKH